jgi:sialate O-acetylesterase
MLCAAAQLDAAVAVASPFTDHAVLQQGVDIPVWGTAADGEQVTVSIAERKVSTTAKAGRWSVRLEPLPAGGPYQLTIAGTNTLVLNDVLIGEVWICSGQSNMERQLGPRPPQQLIENWEQEAATADFPQIRHFGVAHASATEPGTTVTGSWTVCSPATAKDFTAVGFFFGRALHQARKVPIGLLHTSVGGTPAEAWTSREALLASPDTAVIVEAWKQACAAYPAQSEKWHQDEARVMEQYRADAEAAKAAGKPAPRKPEPPRDPGRNPPSRLFNAMVAPLIPYAIRGAIWYQGESNNGQAKLYRSLFPAMIADWRARWGQGDFPFLFVQIAPNGGMSPELREAQLLTLARSPNTAMAVTTDVGDAKDIHPTRKRPVGERLALAARHLAYGEEIEYSGPLYQALRIAGAKAELSFTHADGLAAKDGPLVGFTIAGADKKFVPAKAEIRDHQVIVWSDAVTAPVAVRYGWANVPEVNLVNGAGLPASPFRTDVD